jgi:hypothetical protein
VSGSCLVRTLNLVRWPQMGSLLHTIFGALSCDRFVSSQSPTTLTARELHHCPPRRVRRNTSQPIATAVSGTLQRCTTRRGDMDEGVGGSRERSRRWAVDSPCRSSQMRRGWHSGTRTVWAGWFFVWCFDVRCLGYCTCPLSCG